MIPQIIMITLMLWTLWGKFRSFHLNQKTKTEFYNTLLGILIISIILVWGGFFDNFKL